MPGVVITQNNHIAQAISQALRHIDMEPLVQGKVVAVKPNDTYASEADTTGVTQPDTLRAVLRYVKRFAPREVVVTGGAGAAETDEVFRLAGLMDVVEQEGATFFDHNRPPFTEVALEYAAQQDVSGPQQSVMVKRFPIDLAITVGHPAMGGTGLVIASRDAVAADVVGARLLGFRVQAVRHLWEAKQCRLRSMQYATPAPQE